LVSRHLRANGWTVLRLWHHELKKEDRVVAKIRRALHPKEKA
jgi:very-short-patch-repair endonuclease